MLKNEDGKRNPSFLPNHESGCRSREEPARKDVGHHRRAGRHKTASVLDLEGIPGNIFLFSGDRERITLVLMIKMKKITNLETCNPPVINVSMMEKILKNKRQ